MFDGLFRSQKTLIAHVLFFLAIIGLLFYIFEPIIISLLCPSCYHVELFENPCPPDISPGGTLGQLHSICQYLQILNLICVGVLFIVGLIALAMHYSKKKKRK